MSRANYSGFAPLVLPALLLNACANIPADRGWVDVRNSVAAHGQEISPSSNDVTDTARAATTEKLLAQPLHFEDAITLGLLNSPQMAAIYAQLGLAGAEVLQAGRLSNPKLSGSFGFPLTSGGAGFGFGITQDFLGLLFLPARSRLARADFGRAKATAGAAVMQLAAGIGHSYYLAIEARQNAELLALIEQAADAASTYAQALFDAGNLSELQLDVQKVASAQAELDAEDAAAERDMARLQLNREMGLSATQTEWQLAGGLSLPIAQEDDAQQLQTLAAAQRLDLQAAQAELAVHQAALAFARSTRWLFNAELGSDYARDTDRDRSAGPSISLALPVFEQGQSRLLRAQAEVELAQAQVDELRIDISNEVQSAIEQLKHARHRVDLLGTRLLPLRQSIVEQTQTRANYGLLGVFEPLQAKQQKYAAEQGYLNAIGDYWLARVALARAVGGRLPSDAQIGAAQTGIESFKPLMDQPRSIASAAGPSSQSSGENTAQPAPSRQPAANSQHAHSSHSGVSP